MQGTLEHVDLNRPEERRSTQASEIFLLYSRGVEEEEVGKDAHRPPQKALLAYTVAVPLQSTTLLLVHTPYTSG